MQSIQHALTPSSLVFAPTPRSLMPLVQLVHLVGSPQLLRALCAAGLLGSTLAAHAQGPQPGQTAQAAQKAERALETVVITASGYEQAVEDAQTAYDTAVETTNRAIETAQEAQELNKYKDTDTTSKDTLSNLKEQLADCEITAPCGGVVTAVNSKVGDINAEKNVIMTIEDTSSLKMVATVQEADVLKLQEGMEATVTADATGDEQIKGTVTRVVRVKSQGTTGSDGSTTSAGGYSIEIALDNQELLIGMAVKAKVMIQAKGEVLAVPYDLIQYDDNGQAYVLVAEADDGGNATAVRRNITVGDEVDYYTEVTGGDLAEGDMLIYDTTFSIAEGQTFTPEQMYSEQDMGLTDGTGTEVSE